MIENDVYKNEERDRDFDYFLDHYSELFAEYGKCFIAIRNMQVIGAFSTIREAINALAPEHPIGSYILQECDGTENAYTTRIMGVKISA